MHGEVGAGHHPLPLKSLLHGCNNVSGPQVQGDPVDAQALEIVHRAIDQIT